MRNIVKTENELKKILSDNVSGSAELLSRLAKTFLEEIEAGGDVSRFLVIAEKEFAHFEAIKNFAKRLKELPAEERKKFLREFIAGEKSVYLKIYENLRPKFFDSAKIITISNSKTLFEIFSAARKEFADLQIFVSESRPVNEGVIMAEKLAELGLRVTLITEAMIPAFAERCDFGLIGADKILADGKAVNKIGSKIIALACNYYGKPFYVACGKNKFSSENRFEQKPHPQSEIISETEPPYSVAQNFYFETIEEKLITEIIAD